MQKWAMSVPLWLHWSRKKHIKSAKTALEPILFGSGGQSAALFTTAGLSSQRSYAKVGYERATVAALRSRKTRIKSAKTALGADFFSPAAGKACGAMRRAIY